MTISCLFQYSRETSYKKSKVRSVKSSLDWSLLVNSMFITIKGFWYLVYFWMYYFHVLNWVGTWVKNLHLTVFLQIKPCNLVIKDCMCVCVQVREGIRWLLGIHPKSLIVLAKQNKLWERINSMAIIESEMISHPQHVLSSIGQQPLPQG